MRLDEAANALHVSVFDDGVGGATVTAARRDGTPRPRERVRAARGTFAVSSPATGPTIVSAVLPCGS